MEKDGNILPLGTIFRNSHLYPKKVAIFVFIPGDTVTLGWNGFSDTTHPDFPKFKAALDEDIF